MATRLLRLSVTLKTLDNSSQSIKKDRPICRTMPYTEECDPELEKNIRGAAPYYAEVNIDALQEENFAGGVAFMLVDVLSDKQGKDCTKTDEDTGMLDDYFTGLYAVGGLL